MLKATQIITNSIAAHQFFDAPPVLAFLVVSIFILLILVTKDVAPNVGIGRPVPPLGRPGAPVEVLLDALVEALLRGRHLVRRCCCEVMVRGGSTSMQHRPRLSSACPRCGAGALRAWRLTAHVQNVMHASLGKTAAARGGSPAAVHRAPCRCVTLHAGQQSPGKPAAPQAHLPALGAHAVHIHSRQLLLRFAELRGRLAALPPRVPRGRPGAWLRLAGRRRLPAGGVQRPAGSPFSLEAVRGGDLGCFAMFETNRVLLLGQCSTEDS
jgi:hypothetical protein